MARTIHTVSHPAKKERLFMRASCNRRLFAPFVAMMALAACSDGTPDGGQSANKVPSDTAAPTENAATANIATPARGPQTLATNTESLEFSYSWPSEAASIPALDTWLRSNGEKLRAENLAGAREAQADAKKNDYPFHGYSYAEEYATVADTPRMLVLLSTGYVFTGGAHGMPINTAIIWDKTTQKRLAADALIDIQRFATLSKKRFCDTLDSQRAEKRGGPVRHDDPNQLSDFVQCVDMTKQLILPVSKGGKALDRVQVVIGPYEAGPYVEGSYEIELPLDAALLATVKPAYRDAFAAAR